LLCSHLEISLRIWSITQNTRSQSRESQSHDRPQEARCRLMLERVDFFIRDISAIPVADTARIWSRCLNESNYLKNRKNSLVREGRSQTP
jgi:hypothetical protein